MVRTENDGCGDPLATCHKCQCLMKQQHLSMEAVSHCTTRSGKELSAVPPEEARPMRKLIAEKHRREPPWRFPQSKLCHIHTISKCCRRVDAGHKTPCMPVAFVNCNTVWWRTGQKCESESSCSGVRPASLICWFLSLLLALLMSLFRDNVR